MTKDETSRKKQSKVSVSADCSVGLRRLFQMTITIFPLGGMLYSQTDGERSASRDGLIVRSQMFICFR